VSNRATTAMELAYQYLNSEAFETGNGRAGDQIATNTRRSAIDIKGK
jgi:hypothetical protein